MTFERKVVVSLDEITAIVFECTRCGSKVVTTPERMTLPPTFCPNGHGWNWNIESEHKEVAAPAGAWLASLNRLRLKDTVQSYGFRILLEFKEPLDK
jgi:DNA replicative helicase MCM subunit Mcm2 (Cdc46/Mcm family)